MVEDFLEPLQTSKRSRLSWPSEANFGSKRSKISPSSASREPAERSVLTEEPISHTSDVAEAGETLQEDSGMFSVSEQSKHDAKQQAPSYTRLEDLDERMKRIMAGVASNSPKEALVEFRQLLQCDEGENLLHQYMSLSPKCTEIMSMWSMDPNRDYAVPLLQLFDELMKHPVGKIVDLQDTDPKCRVLQARLDKIARLIISTKLKYIYAHLTSGQRSRQCAALHLLASIVKRGSMLASELATTFDFTLNVLPDLARARKSNKRAMKETTHKWSTRAAFIEFAMSFLEVCHAALLRWVLQIRPLCGAVLHKLSSDDESTVVRVLKVLQLKVLNADAMVPPGLQSAVFGDSALEQIAIISSDVLHAEAAQLAHDILTELCTDESHGICPEPSLLWSASPGKAGYIGGGLGRLVRLMIKLKATEVQNHRDLLLSIALKRPPVVATYFRFFPYHLEPRNTNAWFAAASLVSDIIMVGKVSPPFENLAFQGLPSPTGDSFVPQAILGSVLPRTLTRLIINRGLLHKDILVKHGCLRILSEVLSAGEFYLCSFHKVRSTFQQQFDHRGLLSDAMNLKNQVEFDGCAVTSSDSNDDSEVKACNIRGLKAHDKWLALKNQLQTELRAFLPDPQVLFSLLSLKPRTNSDPFGNKQRKGRVGYKIDKKATLCMEKNDSDVVGIGNLEESFGAAKLVDIWNADEALALSGELEDVEGFLNAKLMEVLASYQRIMPNAMADSCFDVFKLLPEAPVVLTISQQEALLALLTAASGDAPDRACPSQMGFETVHSRHLFRYLKPILKFMLESKTEWAKKQWQLLGQRAMFSCGAFDCNKSEIRIWLQFLFLCDNVVLSFFCDAVESVGKNLEKFMETLVSVTHTSAEQVPYEGLYFGPLLVCILDKCFRVLSSTSKNMKISQRTSVSIYVTNALSLLLQSQVNPRVLSSVLVRLLSSRLDRHLADDTIFKSEWFPLQNLLLYAQWHLKMDSMLFMNAGSLKFQTGSLAKVLKVCKGDTLIPMEAKAVALSSCVQCAPPLDIAENFLLLMGVFFNVFKGKLPVLVGLFGAYPTLFSTIAKIWPEFLEQALLSASGLTHSIGGETCIGSFDGQEPLLSQNGVQDLKGKEMPMSEGEFDIASFAFSVFLLGLPFSIIFPALASSNEARLWGSPHLQSLLEVALSKVLPQDWLCASNLILHWVGSLQCSNGRISLLHECQLRVCFSLLKMLILPSENHGWLSLLKTDTNASAELNLITEFLQGVLTHLVIFDQLKISDFSPSVVSSKGNGSHARINESQVPEVLEQWFQKGVCEMPSFLDHAVSILKGLLLWATDPPDRALSQPFQKDCLRIQSAIMVSCKPFLTQICVAVKKFVGEKNQPNEAISNIALCLAFIFSGYLDLNALAEISCSLLSEELTEEVLSWGPSSSGMSCHAIGTYFATLTFNRLVSLRQGPIWLQTSMPQKNLLRCLYQKVLHIVLKTSYDISFRCLLSGIEAHRSYDYLPCYEWLQISSVAGRSEHLTSIPWELLTCLMTGVNKTKAKIILNLIQSSQFYLSLFAEALSSNLGLGSVPLMKPDPLMLGLLLPQSGHMNAVYTLKEKILFLPPVNWLIHVTFCQDQVINFKVVQQILSSYSETVGEIITDWNVLGTFLDTKDVRLFLESEEHNDNISCLFSATTFDQVVLMLKRCLASHLFSSLEKEKFFSLMIEKNYPLFDLAVRHTDRLKLEATLQLVCVIAAKSLSAKLLLLSEIHEANAVNIKSVASSADVLGEATCAEIGKLYSKTSEIVFVFVSTLCTLFDQRLIVRTEDQGNVSEVAGVQVSLLKAKVLRMLERSLMEDLKCILKATPNVELEAQHIATSKRFTKLVLRYRYGESLPMQVLRLYVSRMIHFPEFCNLYAKYGLDLLVGHSRFAPTLLSHGANAKVEVVAKLYGGSASNLKSLPSILSLLKNPPVLSKASKVLPESSIKAAHGPKLELLKFLRLLYHLKRKAAISDNSTEQTVDPRELLQLLLAAYDASLSRTDIENLLLMREIESVEEKSFPGIAGMDYVWGEPALKWQETISKFDHGCNAIGFADDDNSRELHKRHFSEELPLDPTRCAFGVIFFPMRRKLAEASVFSLDSYEDEEEKFDQDAAQRLIEEASYDPCYMLPFSLHSLSHGLLDARDFVLKGLLALAFMSTASAEESIRKLGYEILANFFSVLEESSSFKGKPQLKLLLIFVKNSVVEPWQRLPSVSALFAAEASCILMSPSDVHYPVINKILFRAASLDLETVPLFKPMFGSGSIYFKADRSWVLRLLAFSLRSSFDTHAYRRRFIIEILMSFYGSPLGDKHTRAWILQILFRASKLRSFAQYLVEHCGLLSWLTAIITSNGASKSGEYLGGISMDLVQEVLQIFENILQWRSVKRWLLSEGFEELSKMAVVLHHAMVETSSFAEPAMLIKPYLRILGTAFRLSGSRKKFQSHFNLPLRDFVALVDFAERETTFTHETHLLMLTTILECEPPACCSIQDRFLLWKLGTWLVSLGLKELKEKTNGDADLKESTYLTSDSGDGDASVKKGAFLRSNSKDVIPTVFGWLSASLILGESHLVDLVALDGAPTAWTFFKAITGREDCGSLCGSDVNKDLLRLLIYQQCLYGTVITNSSAVCAVLLLLQSIEGACDTFIKNFKDFLMWPLQQLSLPYELDVAWRWKNHQTSMQSLFEYEISQVLFTIFQQLVYIEEASELHDVVETIQFPLSMYTKKKATTSLAHARPASGDLWKPLKRLLLVADGNVERTKKVEI